MAFNCFTPAKAQAQQKVEISESPYTRRPATIENSPRLSLSFDDHNQDTPTTGNIMSDDEIQNLFSSREEQHQHQHQHQPQKLEGDSDDDDMVVVESLPSRLQNQLTFVEFLREANDQYSESASPATRTTSHQRRHVIINSATRQTLTALPGPPPPSHIDITAAAAAAAQAATSSMPPPATQLSKRSVTSSQQPTHAAPSRKRKNMSMSLARPFGSLKRRITHRLSISDLKEPQFDRVFPSDLIPHNAVTTTTTATPSTPSASVSSTPRKTIPRYTGEPTLAAPLPIPVPVTTTTSTTIIARRPSRADLNLLITQLQSRLSDVNLENQVLRDQITLVRKDWIDASQELDRERHLRFEGDMERFRLGVKVEALVAELAGWRRGSHVL